VVSGVADPGTATPVSAGTLFYAVAVMRNGPPAAGLAAVTRIDRLIAGTEEHQ